MPASQYMPATTAVAAPVAATTFAAPVAATTVASSFVPAPQAVAAVPQFAAPAPVSLTAGLVEPAKLEAERVAYEKALAAQLDKQSKAVFEEAKIKKAMLEQ